MKNQILTARLPPEIINGIDAFQRKQNLAFRTDALIEIVKVACSAVGIDLSNIASVETPIETKGPSEEETEPNEWLCPHTGRMGGYARCEQRSKQEPEECKACKAIPESIREIIFGEGAEEEEPEEKPITQKLPVIPEKAIEKDTVEVQEPNTSVESQQAVYIKGIHDQLEKKPWIEENQKSTQKLQGQQKLLTEKKPKPGEYEK